MAESITSEQNSIVFSYYFSVVVVSNKIFEKIFSLSIINHADGQEADGYLRKKGRRGQDVGGGVENRSQGMIREREEKRLIMFNGILFIIAGYVTNLS